MKVNRRGLSMWIGHAIVWPSLALAIALVVEFFKDWAMFSRVTEYASILLPGAFILATTIWIVMNLPTSSESIESITDGLSETTEKTFLGPGPITVIICSAGLLMLGLGKGMNWSKLRNLI